MKTLMLVTSLLLSVSAFGAKEEGYPLKYAKNAIVKLDELQTTFIKRRYIFRYELKEILDQYRVKGQITKSSVLDLIGNLEALKKKIVINDNVDPSVKMSAVESIESSIRELEKGTLISKYEKTISKLKSSEAIYKEEALENKKTADALMATVKKNKIDAVKQSESEASKIQQLSLLLGGGALFGLFGAWGYRRKKLSEIEKMKTRIISLKKAPRREGGKFKVLESMNRLNFAIVDLDGKVQAASTSFKKLFADQFDLKNGNWDEFFEQNFEKAKDIDAGFRYIGDPLSVYFIESNLNEAKTQRSIEIEKNNIASLIEFVEKTKDSAEGNMRYVSDVVDNVFIALAPVLTDVRVLLDKYDKKLMCHSHDTHLSEALKQYVLILTSVVKDLGLKNSVELSVVRESNKLRFFTTVTENQSEINEERIILKNIQENDYDFMNFNSELYVKKITVNEESKFEIGLMFNDKDMAIELEREMVI